MRSIEFDSDRGSDRLDLAGKFVSERERSVEGSRVIAKDGALTGIRLRVEGSTESNDVFRVEIDGERYRTFGNVRKRIGAWAEGCSDADGDGMWSG